MSIESTNQDISLDNVLQTGENENRTPNPTVDAVEDAPPVGTVTIEDNASTEGTDNRSKINTLLKSYTSEDNLADEQKQTRTQLLEKFAGKGFDANGNIVDDKGNVVKSFDDIYDYISDDSTSTDEQGNQVDAEGNIVKSAYELAVENTVVNKIASQSGYNFVDDNGNPKIYSDDEAGFNALANDVSAERFVEFKQEFFGQNPELAEIAKHILGGGTIDTYKQDVDYSQVNTASYTTEQKVNLINQSFLDSGLSPERAKSITDLIVNSNSVEEEFSKAIKALEGSQANRSIERDRRYQEQIERQHQEVQQYWDTVEASVTSGKIGDINIPEKDRANFFDYMSTAVDDKGNSKEMLDAQAETQEQKLMSAYWRFKGYNFKDLIGTEVKNEKVQGLKELIRKSAKLTPTPINDADTSKTSGDANITISSLLG